MPIDELTVPAARAFRQRFDDALRRTLPLFQCTAHAFCRRRLPRLVFACCSALFLAAMPGCNEAENGETDTAPFAGQHIRVAVPSGLGLPETWDVFLDEWSAQTRASVQLDEYHLPENGHPLTDVAPFASPVSEGKPADVLVFPITRIVELSSQNLLAVIPGELQAAGELNWLDVFQGLRDKVASVKGKPTVIPLSCPALVCYYRRDLLKAAELSPPETWADYQTLLDSLSDWAPGLSAAEPWGEEFRATMFMARAAAYAKHPANYSVYFDIQTGEPLIDQPGFRRALSESQRALSKMPQRVKGYTPGDVRREIIGGRAALAIAFETGPENAAVPFGPAGNGVANATEPVAPVQRRDEAAVIGFCRLPGSTEVFNLITKSWEQPRNAPVHHATLAAFAGLCAGVSNRSGAGRRRAAWNLIETLTLQRLEHAFPGAAKSPCREQQLADSSPWVGRELSLPESYEYLDAVAASLRDRQLIAELPVVGRLRFRRTLTDGITAVMEDTAEPQKALESVAVEWRDIVNDIGREHVRDTYRQSLGLYVSPK